MSVFNIRLFYTNSWYMRLKNYILFSFRSMVLCAFECILAPNFQKSSRRLIRGSNTFTGSLKRVVAIKNTVPFSLFASFRQLEAKLKWAGPFYSVLPFRHVKISPRAIIGANISHSDSQFPFWCALPITVLNLDDNSLGIVALRVTETHPELGRG